MVLTLYGPAFGAIVEKIIGPILYALSGGDGTSPRWKMKTGRYNVLVDEEIAEEASRSLGELPQVGEEK